MHQPHRHNPPLGVVLLLAACSLCFSSALAQPTPQEIDTARASCAMEKARVRQLEARIDQLRAQQSRNASGTEAHARATAALGEVEGRLPAARRDWEHACVRANALMSNQPAP